tara:strand:+ start:4323 stop:4532 length:210 start_codon:yes stop_codon:yes gene_type:complete
MVRRKTRANLVVTGVEPSSYRAGQQRKAAAKKPAAKGRSPAQKAARKDKGYESRAAYMRAYRARKKAGK